MGEAVFSQMERLNRDTLPYRSFSNFYKQLQLGWDFRLALDRGEKIGSLNLHQSLLNMGPVTL